MNEKRWWLYVLLLEDKKYYVGITSQTPEKRYTEHVNNIRPANWTKKYKPLEIIDRKDLGEMTREAAEAYENKAVRKYMAEKGYNNVRGGDLTDESDYVKRFGRLLMADDWQAIVAIVFLLLIILVLALV